jgi:hypothetical protein
VQKISLVKNEQECEKRKGAGEKIQSDYMGHIKMAYWLREKEKFHVSNHQSYRAAAALSLKLHQATFPSRSWLNCGKIHFEFRLLQLRRRRRRRQSVVMIIGRHRIASYQAAQKIGSLHYNDFPPLGISFPRSTPAVVVPLSTCPFSSLIFNTSANDFPIAQAFYFSIKSLTKNNQLYFKHTDSFDLSNNHLSMLERVENYSEH